jgi:hypothetical protein
MDPESLGGNVAAAASSPSRPRSASTARCDLAPDGRRPALRYIPLKLGPEYSVNRLTFKEQRTDRIRPLHPPMPDKRLFRHSEGH